MLPCTRKTVATLACGSVLEPIVVATTLAVALTLAFAPAPAEAGKAQWSMFEDHARLVRASTSTRERTLSEVGALGADTIRIEVRWSEVAPAPLQRTRPSFDASNPGAYPGFGPYDDLVRRAAGLGFRLL